MKIRVGAFRVKEHWSKLLPVYLSPVWRTSLITPTSLRGLSIGVFGFCVYVAAP